MIDLSMAGNEDEALALALLKAMEDGDLAAKIEDVFFEFGIIWILC